tara:strand:- start:1640 stop:3058 length:1419 start_codon:yes stop_codon:yes gene_type:complete
MTNYFSNKKTIIIYGLGISGISCAKYVANNLPNKLILSDDNIDNLHKIKKNLKNANQNIKYTEPENLEFDYNSLIICSPGIAIYDPAHPILLSAKKKGAQIICDIELFFSLNNKQNYIAITGTNGKSTCSALTYHILNELNINCQIGGNIGIPIFDLTQDKNQNINYILEISSYQLDLIANCKFNIAAITNIDFDHIERYKNIENYTKSKKQIFNHQASNDYAIFNIDNKISNNLYQDFINKNNQNILAISNNKVTNDAISLVNNNIHVKYKSHDLSFAINSKYLIGKHNTENILLSFSVVFCYLLQQNIAINIAMPKIITAINNFKGLKHRLEYIGNINNIKFYNDSKATNAQSTKCALESLDNIYWIVGGKEKGDDLLLLKPFFHKVKKAYLIGSSANKFSSIFKQNGVKYILCNILETATKKALFDAKNDSLSQNTILLSPACASFDQWQNFEQRGNAFCKIFNDLSKN